MVDEWLALRVVFGRVENLMDHLLDELGVRRLVKALVERDQWSAVLQAVACQLRVVLRVDVRDQELERWTTGALAHPHEQVLLLVLFEEEEVVAGQLVAEVIDDVLHILTIDSLLLLRVGE